MARSPRTRTGIENDDEADAPFKEAMLRDSENVAEQFASIVEEFGGTSDGSVKGHLYKVQRSGKFEWIGEYWPPFDQAEIFREVRENYNGGDFQMRIMVQGRRGVQKTLTFAVAPAPNHGQNVPQKDNGDTMQLFAIMMQQSAEARRESQASADRQMQMMMAMGQQNTTMLTALLPAMMGQQMKPAELVAMMQSMKGPETGGLGGTLELLKTAKGLFTEGGSGDAFDPEDMVGSVVKIGGPIIGALARNFEQRRVQGPQGEAVQLEAPTMVPLLPAGAPSVAAPIIVAEPETIVGTGRFPVLDLVREDVLFHFKKKRSPEFTASVVLELFDENHVDEGLLNDLIAAATVSSDWLADLAAEGIDLRSDPEWAQSFMGELVRLYTADDELDDHPGGGDGSEGDLDRHGGSGAPGVNGHVAETGRRKPDA